MFLDATLVLITFKSLFLALISQLQTWIPNWSSDHLYWNVQNWSHFLSVIPFFIPSLPYSLFSYDWISAKCPRPSSPPNFNLLICFYIDILITTHCISSGFSLHLSMYLLSLLVQHYLLKSPTWIIFLFFFLFFLKLLLGLFFSFKYLLIYLAVLGLSYGTRGLQSSLGHVGSLVVARAYGI